MPVVVSCTTRLWAGPEAKGFLEMHLQGQPLAEAPPPVDPSLPGP